MRFGVKLAVGLVLVAVAAVELVGRVRAQGGQPVGRLAEIEVDPQQVAQYDAALCEGVEAALRLEPGVLALYAVSVKGHPEQVRVFEVYASQAAYEAHLQTPHFKKYKAAVQGMVRSLRLVETDPIQIGAKELAVEPLTRRK